MQFGQMPRQNTRHSHFARHHRHGLQEKSDQDIVFLTSSKASISAKSSAIDQHAQSQNLQQILAAKSHSTSAPSEP